MVAGIGGGLGVILYMLVGADVKLRSPLEAIAGFDKVVALEKEQGVDMEW